MNTTMIMARLQFVTEQIKKNRSILELSSGETVFARKRKDGTWFYFKKELSEDGKRKEKYLKKEEREKAFQIAAWMKAEQELKDLQEEKQLLEKLLQFYDRDTRKEQFLKDHPGLS